MVQVKCSELLSYQPQSFQLRDGSSTAQLPPAFLHPSLILLPRETQPSTGPTLLLPLQKEDLQMGVPAPSNASAAALPRTEGRAVEGSIAMPRAGAVSARRETRAAGMPCSASWHHKLLLRSTTRSAWEEPPHLKLGCQLHGGLQVRWRVNTMPGCTLLIQADLLGKAEHGAGAALRSAHLHSEPCMLSRVSRKR